jgi:hypothetical protein
MNFKYSAVVSHPAEKNKVTVSGFAKIDDRSSNVEYQIKCAVLRNHFKPNEVVGTDNVNLIFFKEV